jgi:hypothetical protein
MEGHATKAIAAHLGDRSVGVDHDHPAVGARIARRNDEQDPIGTNPEPAIAKAAHARDRERVVAVGIDDDEIVSQALILLEPKILCVGKHGLGVHRHWLRSFS